MRKAFFYTGVLLVGAAVGAFGMHLLTEFDLISVDPQVPILDLAQLAATLGLALYIPLAIDGHREKTKFARDVLLAFVKRFADGVQEINATIRQCAETGVTTDQDRMRIRAGFLASDSRVSALEEQVRAHCGEACEKRLRHLKEAYGHYFDTVTGGSLYGSGSVDWSLWRRQEASFNPFWIASDELLKSVHGSY